MPQNGSVPGRRITLDGAKGHGGSSQTGCCDTINPQGNTTMVGNRMVRLELAEEHADRDFL